MAEGGTLIPAADRTDVVARFGRSEFHDPATGEALPYALFVPDGADEEGASFPLVLFIHDAGNLGSDPAITLEQGDGAVCWASPGDQAARPCFVLAPQYPRRIVDDFDGHVVDPLVGTTIALIDHVLATRAIDPDRVYATGQSMGGMTEMVVAAERPDLFAASLLVACQWEPSVAAGLARQHVWIVVSEGDAKAYPGQEAVVAALEQQGADVSRWTWPVADAALRASAAAESDARIHFTAFERGSMPIDGDDPLAHHMATWPIAYDLDPIRAWLFRWRRETAAAIDADR